MSSTMTTTTETVSTTCHSVSKNGTISRLLYRGALSLPDSDLLLDGLTFTLDFPSEDTLAGRALLEAPLPLALESMRGRPSLQFIGAVKMDDPSLHCDFSGNVTLHVHPRCILTRQLFSHNLCTKPITSPTGRSEVGIRIRLGEAGCRVPSSSPSDIIVYGTPHPCSSSLILRVSLVVPPPVAPVKPLRKPTQPRPDDPTPRLPPSGPGLARIGFPKKPFVRTNSSKGKEKEEGPLKKKAKKEADPSTLALKRKASALSIPVETLSNLGKQSRLGNKTKEILFKVPQLPVRPSNPKDKPRLPDPKSADNKGQPSAQDDFENLNKTLIKKASVRLLANAGINNDHPEFKDLFGYVYRGTMFALRSSVKTASLESDSRVDSFAKMHVHMYIGNSISVDSLDSLLPDNNKTQK